MNPLLLPPAPPSKVLLEGRFGAPRSGCLINLPSQKSGKSLHLSEPPFPYLTKGGTGAFHPLLPLLRHDVYPTPGPVAGSQDPPWSLRKAKGGQRLPSSGSGSGGCLGQEGGLGTWLGPLFCVLTHGLGACEGGTCDKRKAMVMPEHRGDLPPVPTLSGPYFTKADLEPSRGTVLSS